MKQLSRWISILVFVVGLTLSLPTQARTPLVQAPALTESGKQQGDKYPTVPMHRGKLGQDKSGGVIYLDARQREERRVVIENGLLCDHTGKPLTTRSKHRNQNNYVMDAAGNFYLFDEFTHPEIRHSSIFAGGPVAGAGNIEITEGQLVYIDSDSGHYPAEGLFQNVHKELAAHGVTIGGRKPEGSVKSEKAVKSAESETSVKSDRSVKAEKSGKSKKAEKSAESETSVKSDRSVKAEKSVESEKAVESAESEKSVNPDESGKPGKQKKQKKQKKGKKQKKHQTEQALFSSNSPAR